jgi:putative DNA primase/helicase
VEIEGHPWADRKGGKPITKNALALLLAPFPIVSVNIRVGDRVVKGYQVAQFQDAFERYL